MPIGAEADPAALAADGQRVGQADASLTRFATDALQGGVRQWGAPGLSDRQEVGEDAGRDIGGASDGGGRLGRFGGLGGLPGFGFLRGLSGCGGPGCIPLLSGEAGGFG